MAAASFGLGRSGEGSGAQSSQHAQPAQQEQPPGEPMDSSTPWLAIADGNLSLLQTSLQVLNLPATAADENGYTLLQAAASYSHIPILQWLIEQVPTTTNSSVNHEDAKLTMLNAVDFEGDTALHYASTKAAAEFLIHCGIDVNIRNAEGRTALESKQAEIEDAMMEAEEEEDDDNDNANVEEKEEDEELSGLREVAAYLSSLDTMSQ
ncbi:hypothetical protein ACA910_016960 [Epithemia clementina (nom. ined.)]